ncbi:hypothetical protein CKF54_01305 [Psittacicella hinzii]|uniref:Purine nucleoside phosphorylase n=1 Tax=Psittacicella hinzii TaxID=2028575 RepID=A0A3A1Y977_9GAMM|nr:peptidoglycan editing factor PgeF [Psittacicella hinzii]RIY34101.1 hypothetical protein CKF54_01305 [Psittacicella hinzii]
MSKIETITPNWPLKKVKALATTRFGGVSHTDYFSLNLASHVGDNLNLVNKNRQLVRDELELPEDPLWITQVSGAHVIKIPVDKTLLAEYNYIKDHPEQESSPEKKEIVKIFSVDAVYTKEVNKVCTILTADCVPLLLATADEKEVAAVHAGWRGLVSGVVENALSTFSNRDYAQMYAWIGPCIGKESFVVGSDVLMEFAQKDRDFLTCFTPYIQEENKWLGDLPKITELILRKFGVQVKNIYHSEIDTFQDSRFYSYRRDRVTGRFASMIWIDE